MSGKICLIGVRRMSIACCVGIPLASQYTFLLPGLATTQGASDEVYRMGPADLGLGRVGVLCEALGTLDTPPPKVPPSPVGR